jgi:hypothetical protein
VINPIDAFIAAEQEKRGLKPLPPADNEHCFAVCIWT